MIGEFFKGNVKDVCAELEAEGQRCKGMTVGEWLRLRKIEQAVAKQFGTSVGNVRRYATNK